LDFLIPVLGSITGIDPANWKDIMVFALKVVIFCIPFVAVGVAVEKDILRVPPVNRAIKIAVLITVSMPFFLLGLLNHLAPRLPDSFWDAYPYLEDWWIIEGKWTPMLLMGFIVLFVLLYTLEVLGGDLSK